MWNVRAVGGRAIVLVGLLAASVAVFAADAPGTGAASQDPSIVCPPPMPPFLQVPCFDLNDKNSTLPIDEDSKRKIDDTNKHLRDTRGGQWGLPSTVPNTGSSQSLDVPANLSVTPRDIHLETYYLDISWSAVDGATSYDVQAQAAGASDWIDVASATGTSHSYGTTLTIDYVRVRARNTSGTGDWAQVSRMPAADWLTTVQSTGGASASSGGSIAAKLDAPASVAVTRDNYPEDEKLHVTWASVTGATGYNLACSDLNGWSWWQCGSATSGATTTLTIDTDARNTRDLVWTRSYLVSVRAVTSNDADASDWVPATNAHPALQPSRSALAPNVPPISFTRQAGSITLSWTATLYSKGYEIECATGTGGGTYTRCADVENANVTAGATITATITSWTAGGTDYSIDDTSIYDIKVRTTNDWGASQFTLAPLIHPVTLLNVSGVGPTTATLTLLNHTGNWYYKHTNAGATCEGPVSTTSKALTGLTANAGYTYSAYSDSGCTAANLLAAAAPFTTVSSVSSLTSAKSSGGGDVGGGKRQAVAFTTGSNASGYVLKSITVPLRSASAAGGTNGFQLKLHAMQGTGQYSTSSAPAATALATLSGAAPTASAYADTTFTCSGSGCSLSANTVYFVVATFDGSGKYQWAYAATETQTAQPSGNGWDIEFGHEKQDSPTPRAWESFSDYNLAQIVFENVPNPKLTASNVSVTTATLTIANHTGAWYYKHTGASATCEGPVSGTTKDLTGLTANTTYTYSAYSDSSCTTANLLSAAAPFSTFSSISNLGSARSGDSTVSTALSQAVAFTTGSNAGGYVLKSFTLPLKKRGGTYGVTATLHAMQGTGAYSSTSEASATVLATLSGTAPTATSSDYANTTFTCAGSGCKLSSGATYFLVLKSLGHPGYQWAYAGSETEIALPAGNGWSVGFGHYQQPGFAWGSHSDWNVARIAFVNAPGLTSSNVAATTATLTIADHTGDWYYKHTNTGATCDGPVSGASKNLTGLDKNTAYTYSAYSDSGCANLLATAAAFTTLVGDTVSVSNLDETTLALFTVQTGASHAQEFTTGATTGVYKLTSVTVNFTLVSNPAVVTVAIHDKQSNGTPATTARATLSGTPASGQAEFTCSGSGCDLDANTSYFVYVSVNASIASYPSSTASDNQTLVPTGTGWSIADAARSQSVNWAELANGWSMQIKVEATVEAKLTSSSITATGATLTIGGHTGQWWYKATSGPHTSCQGPVAAGTSAKALTGLTAGTNYTYSAYSDSACSTGKLLATAAQFKTLATLTSSNVAATTATLTIAGHTGTWYYKSTTTGQTTCTAVAANTSAVNLTGLTAGTSYTYSAYSNSGCTTLLATAPAFTTSASLTASSVTGTGATLTLAGHSGNWYYKANRAPDASCSSTAETGTTKTLSSLTAGTVYAYTAYSASGCADAARVATAVFGTPSTVSVSNLTKANNDNAVFAVAPDYAQEFATGSTASTLSSVTLNFSSPVHNASGITVSIRSVQSNGTPATTDRATLTGTPVGGNASFTCDATNTNNNCSLDASTSYFVFVDGSGFTFSAYLNSTLSDDEDLQPSGNGWSIANAARYQAGAWAPVPSSSSLKMTVSATAASSASLTATSTSLTIGDYTGSWYYQANAAPHAACSDAVTTTTATLSGLTSSTSYTYRAYADSTCAPDSLLATAAAFTTP